MLAGAFAVTVCWLLRRVWRGEMDWIDGAAWAMLAMLVASSSLLPWYVAWLLPLAALGRDRRLAATAIVFTGVIQGIMLLGYIPHGFLYVPRPRARTMHAMSVAPRVFDGEPRELTLVSVVAPVYNEDATIDEFHARVCAALDTLPFELVLVDDGSTDGTPMKLEALAANDPRVRVVYLSRNFGHQTALTAGLDHARGNAVVMLDADLQDPPELISTMLDHWRAGCDVVYAVREQREGESRFKLSTARWFYRLFDKLAQVELQHNSGDFRLLDRRALDALLSMRERNRFLRGMTVWVGYTQAAVPYHRDSALRR